MSVASKLGKSENILHKIQFLLVSLCNTSDFSAHCGTISFTLCCQVTYKDVIGIPCCVDGSHILTFSYVTSCKCIFQRVWLTYHLKVIDNLIQDVWVSSYKQIDHS
jgi:hypothetical protein